MLKRELDHWEFGEEVIKIEWDKEVWCLHSCCNAKYGVVHMLKLLGLKWTDKLSWVYTQADWESHYQSAGAKAGVTWKSLQDFLHLFMGTSNTVSHLPDEFPLYSGEDPVKTKTCKEQNNNQSKNNVVVVSMRQSAGVIVKCNSINIWINAKNGKMLAPEDSTVIPSSTIT